MKTLDEFLDKIFENDFECKVCCNEDAYKAAKIIKVLLEKPKHYNEQYALLDKQELIKKIINE